MEQKRIIASLPSENQQLESSSGTGVICESKIESNSQGSFKQMDVSNSLQSNSAEIKGSSSIKINAVQLNTLRQETTKKFFVKMMGYDPQFFIVSDISKKFNDIIDEYLKEINVNNSEKIKKSFYCNEKVINLDETIKDIEHLSWITSDFNN